MLKKRKGMDMERFTWQKPDGEWGLYGYDIKEVPKALYGAICKLKDYEQAGTVGEFREAVERQKAKKPVKDEYNHNCCPGCGWIVYQTAYRGRYLPCCENCGQAIDWDGEKDEAAT